MASSAKKQKTIAISKELSTFPSWQKENIIGYQLEEKNNRSLVTKIWCKLCAKHKSKILQDPSQNKGAVASSLTAFTEGTNVVTKYQVSYKL